jgi:hypothetical protein
MRLEFRGKVMKLCINICLIRAFIKCTVTYVNVIFLVTCIYSIVYPFLKVHKVNVLWRVK